MEYGRRLFEGTIPPSKRLFHHSVHGDRTVEPRTPPKDRSLPWVSLPLLVNAEVATPCVPTSIACQRYHTPDCPHLRHGRPPRCSLVADSAQIGRIKGKKRVERCSPVAQKKHPHGGIERLSGVQMLPPIDLYLKVLGGFFQEAPKRTPRTPTNPNLSKSLFE